MKNIVKKFNKLSQGVKVAVILISLIVLTAVVQIGIRLLLSRAVVIAPSVNFEQTSYQFPGSGSVKVRVNPNGSVLGYVKVVVIYDRYKIKLANNPTTSDVLKRVLKVSTMSEANAIGQVHFILGLDPNDTATMTTAEFELATLNFIPATSEVNASTNLSFNRFAMQAVSTSKASFIPNTNSASVTVNPGTVEPTATPYPQEIIIDNFDTGYSERTNNDPWTDSTYTNFYGATSRKNYCQRAGDTASWETVVTQGGTWRIDAWWTTGPSRVRAAQYQVYVNGNLVETQVRSQQSNGGRFNLLGYYQVDVGSSIKVVLLDYPASGYTCGTSGTENQDTVAADAVRFSIGF